MAELWCKSNGQTFKDHPLVNHFEYSWSIKNREFGPTYVDQSEMNGFYLTYKGLYDKVFIL